MQPNYSIEPWEGDGCILRVNGVFIGHTEPRHRIAAAISFLRRHNGRLIEGLIRHPKSVRLVTDATSQGAFLYLGDYCLNSMPEHSLEIDWAFFYLRTSLKEIHNAIFGENDASRDRSDLSRTQSMARTWGGKDTGGDSRGGDKVPGPGGAPDDGPRPA